MDGGVGIVGTIIRSTLDVVIQIKHKHDQLTIKSKVFPSTVD